MRWYALFLATVVLIGCNKPLSFLSAVWNAVYQMTKTKTSDIDPYRFLTTNEKTAADLEAYKIYSKFGSKEAPKRYLDISDTYSTPRH